MNSLTHAAQTIETEIAHMRARIAGLESALASIRSTTGKAATVASRSKANGAARPAEQRMRTSKTQSPRRGSGLPSTGGSFWLDVLGGRRKSMHEIVDGALQKLKLDDSARSKIAARAMAWIYPSIKAGAVKPAGMKGRYKTYQRA